MAIDIADLKARFTDPTAAELELVAQYAAQAEDGRRARTFDAFLASGLPHRRMENWKWSDFRAALPSIEAVEPRSAVTLSEGLDGPVIRLGGTSTDLPDSLPKGLAIHKRTDAQALGDAEDVPLGALTASLANRPGHFDTLIVEVTGEVDVPLHVIMDGKGAETNFARLAVIVRPGGRLDLIENHMGGAGFSSYLIEIGMQEGGHVTRTILQQGTEKEALAITGLVHLGHGSVYEQTALALGAKIARIETRLTHQKPDSHARLDAAYLCGAGFHADFTSHVRHGAPSCVTRQVTKGAVLKGGRGVFQGKFLVPRDVGQHTDADMQHQALLLEDGAEVFAKPELEIYADDVECAHGNTSGALDDDQLFYLRQRGLPEAEARAMLTEAFIAEAFESAPESVRAKLLSRVQHFLAEVGS